MDVKDKLPVSMQLPADPESNIWYFYNTLTCTAYLDGHKILIVLTIPLLDRKEIYEIYKIHNLPLPKNQKLTSEAKTLNAVAKYDISAEALMINEDRTKYTWCLEKITMHVTTGTCHFVIQKVQFIKLI